MGAKGRSRPEPQSVETENSWGAGIKRGCGRLSWIHYACDVLSEARTTAAYWRFLRQPCGRRRPRTTAAVTAFLKSWFMHGATAIRLASRKRQQAAAIHVKPCSRAFVLAVAGFAVHGGFESSDARGILGLDFLHGADDGLAFDDPGGFVALRRRGGAHVLIDL